MDFALAARIGQIQSYLEVEELGQLGAISKLQHRVLRKYLRNLFCTHTANEVAGTQLFPRPPFEQ